MARDYNTQNYRRKPKAKRVPPVKRWDFFSQTKEEAKLSAAINFQQVVYGWSVSIHAKPGKSATLLIQRYVARPSPKKMKMPLRELEFRRPLHVPYTTAETTHVRTIYLTSKGNVGYLFYDVNRDNNGKVRRANVSPLQTYIMPNFHGQTYGCTIPKSFFTPNEWSGFIEFAGRTIGKDARPQINYPMTEFIHPSMRLIWGVKVLRSTSAAEVVQCLFGKRLMRRDLVRAVGATLSRRSTSQAENSARLFWAYCFKGLVPVDWIVDMLNKPNSYVAPSFITVGSAGELKAKYALTRRALEEIKPLERKAILMAALNSPATALNELVDIGRQFSLNRHYPPIAIPEHRNFRSIREYHDVYFAEVRRIQRIEREAQAAANVARLGLNRIGERDFHQPSGMFINYHPEADKFAQKITEPKVGNTEIVFARDYEMLQSWGDYMHNCIASYFNTKTLLGGFYKDGELLANFEICAVEQENTMANIRNRYGEHSLVPSIPFLPYRSVEKFELRQLLGKYNQSLDKDIKDHIMLLLSEYGVDMPAYIHA